MNFDNLLFSNQKMARVYQQLVNEEDARVCTDISDSACKVVPGNFLLQVATQFLTKLGDAIANPKTVLAWLMSALSAPAAFTAFLVPIRESGSLIPQLIIAAWVRRQAVRKWTFVLGCVLQGLAVAAMGLVAITLDGSAAGIALLTTLIVFSLSRGLCSVASKDVLGKTVPKTRRGRVSGWSEFLAGIVTIGVGASLLLGTGEDAGMTRWLILLVCAAALWMLAAGTYATIREYPGATEGGGNAITEALGRLSLLRTDREFRRFVIARSLLLCSALSAPFFILLAHQNTAGAILALGLFVIADGIAGLVSAPFWGKFADLSSRKVMIIAGASAALTGVRWSPSYTGFPPCRAGLAVPAVLLPALGQPFRGSHGPQDLHRRSGRGKQAHRLRRGQQYRDRIRASGRRQHRRAQLRDFAVRRHHRPRRNGHSGAWMSSRLPEVTE